jgi:hypothetical protein
MSSSALTTENSAVVMIDHAVGFGNVFRSHDLSLHVNNTVGLARTAGVLASYRTPRTGCCSRDQTCGSSVEDASERSVCAVRSAATARPRWAFCAVGCDTRLCRVRPATDQDDLGRRVPVRGWCGLPRGRHVGSCGAQGVGEAGGRFGKRVREPGQDDAPLFLRPAAHG